MQMDLECFTFGPYNIDPKEVFYSTNLSYAMVNLRPLLPGKPSTVLLCLSFLSIIFSEEIYCSFAL